MKNDRKLLEINNKFKESLDEKNKSKWECICNYSTNTSIMTLFVSGICKNERYNYSSNFISGDIINQIKSEKNISFMSNTYYFGIKNLFYEFLNFYRNNSDFREDVKTYLYEYKKNLIQSKNNKKLNNLINFIEKKDSENSEKYRKNLEYIFSFLSEQDILFIFDQFQKQSEELHKLNQKNEKDPFHKVEGIMDNKIRERNVNEKFIGKINSLFGLYLNLLKSNKRVLENLGENTLDASKVQDNTKSQIFDTIETTEGDGFGPIVVVEESRNPRYGIYDRTDDCDIIAPINYSIFPDDGPYFNEDILERSDINSEQKNEYEQNYEIEEDGQIKLKFPEDI